ncbi:periplasmic heavy metal sensor [Rubrivivax sp. JA1024]|nr:periplasmic heavy metal sensor [Rubrivivax sp. JA1024]
MKMSFGRFTAGRWLLLGSLCLNVALGAYVGAQWLRPPWAPLHAGVPMRLIERVASRLPPADAEVLWRNFHAKEATLKPLQRDYVAALRATLNIAAQPELDKAALRAAVEATRDKRSKVGDAMIDTFVETLEQISPEGRRRLADGLFR